MNPTNKDDEIEDKPSAPAGYRFLVQAFVRTEQEAVAYAKRTFSVAKVRPLACKIGVWRGDYDRTWTFHPAHGWTVFVRTT